MDDVKSKFLQELVSSPPELIVSVWILDSIPYPFQNDQVLYAKWRHRLADMLEVDSSEVRITGSSAFGISLNPHKNYKDFDGKSDIDVAIMSEHFFNLSWRYLRNLGTKRHSMPPPAKQAIKDHVQKYIYWGTIATDRILPYLPFGKDWSIAIGEMAKEYPTRHRSIKLRIYKDFESLRAYQVNNLKQLRDRELEKEI